MNFIEAVAFIDKAIDKTKGHNLKWKTLSSNYELKPIPNEIKGFLLSAENSYIAPFQTGTIQLLVYRTDSPFLAAPPDDSILSLRVQDDLSKYAVEVANSDSLPASASSLIRLYNLIDKDNSSVRTLINNFLNS